MTLERWAGRSIESSVGRSVGRLNRPTLGALFPLANAPIGPNGATLDLVAKSCSRAMGSGGSRVAWEGNHLPLSERTMRRMHWLDGEAALLLIVGGLAGIELILWSGLVPTSDGDCPPFPSAASTAIPTTGSGFAF